MPARARWGQAAEAPVKKHPPRLRPAVGAPALGWGVGWFGMVANKV